MTTELFTAQMKRWKANGTLDRLSTLYRDRAEVWVFRTNGDRTPCWIKSIGAERSTVIVEWTDENDIDLQKFVYLDRFIAANPELFPNSEKEDP